MLNARAESGQNYRVLSNVSTLSGAPLGPGGTSAGKLYFDVVGDVPNSVVHNDGVQDLLVWVCDRHSGYARWRLVQGPESPIRHLISG